MRCRWLANQTMIAIVLLTLGFTPAAAQPWQICGDTAMNYTTSGRHHANLELLSTMLTDNATASPYHFATGSAGAAPDTVYGLALCRGDVNATACRACIAAACLGAQQLCPYRDDATVFYPTCRLRFSGKNFTHPDDYTQIVDGVVNTMNTMDTTNAEPELPGWDPGNAESAAAITEIIRELLQVTARQAAYNSGARMFATGRMDAGGGSFPALYSMAQCVPALTHRDCSSCLQVISFMATDNFAGRQGGRLLALWCNLRYDTIHFYSGDPMVTIVSPVKEVVRPAPLVVPSRKHKRGMIKVVVPLLASIIGLIISFILIRRRRIKGKGYQDKAKVNMKEDETIVWGLEGRSSEFMIYDFSQVLEATANFSEENKLGQGGFGPVYKGRCRDGLEIAVKRLASHSGQGFTQFKNEVQLIAKLQHTNLMKQKELYCIGIHA
ncbi:cysteine-rich receptor-like protein kinase 10 [Panicum miliaceum]|uniref:Cysteine-rich receptor-like protein kinase 10 n=1 Tax=Panicum miliaceum TaxID=4540 RepID=A0A3L6PFT1_PANMI|nr:cysteine-rich receptor-like protein kinase 10 [Panicum miliaceum]